MTAHDLEGEVFERPLPPLLAFAFLIALLLACCAAAFGPLAVDEVRALAAQLPWVDADVFAGLLVVATTGGAGLLFFAASFWAGRRYGRAVITRDHVVITPILPRFRKIVVPRDDVRSVRETRHGLLLDAPLARSRALALLLPPLVPAGDADLARAHALLDPGRRVARPDASASGVLSNMTIGALVVPPLLLLCVPVWFQVTGEDGVIRQLFTALVALVLAVVVALPGRRRVHLGDETVSIGALCGRWEDVRTFVAWDGWVAIRIGEVMRSAHVGREAVARLTPLARAKLGVDEVAPTWFRPRRVRLAAGFALALAVHTLVGPYAAFTEERSITVMDHNGHHVTLHYRVLDARPRRVIVMDDLFERSSPPDLSVLRDATIAHVRVDRIDVSTRPLPMTRDWPHGTTGPVQLDRGLDLLEDWFPDTTDPTLRDFLDGRTTTRCFAVQTSDGWLVTRVREGVVEAAGWVPMKYIAWRLNPCVTCEALRQGGKAPSAVATAVRWFDPRPTLEQVLAAQRLVRRGVSVAEATALFTR